MKRRRSNSNCVNENNCCTNSARFSEVSDEICGNRRRCINYGCHSSNYNHSASSVITTIIVCIAVGSVAVTYTSAFSTTKSIYYHHNSKQCSSIENELTLQQRRQSQWLPLRAVFLEQPSEDTSSKTTTTTSSSSSSTKAKTILPLENNSNEWIRWEQDLIQLGRQGRTDDALELFETLMASFMSLSLGSSSSSSSSSRQQQQQQMHQQQRLPPLSTRVRWWNAALDACARARPARCDAALALFHRGLQWQLLLPSQVMRDDENNNDNGINNDNEEPQLRVLQPNVFTFGVLSSACARARRADLALELLRNMESKYGVIPNAVVYSTVISACARAWPQPMVSTAIDLLREATNERRLAMNVVGFNAVLAACANAGDWQQAMAILESMETANTFNTTTNTKQLSSTSSPFLPLPLLPQPDMVTYGTVMAACERAEQWQLVLACAKRASRQYPNGMDGLALTSALHACQQLGLAEEALQYLELMKLQHTEGGGGGDHKKTFGWQRQGAKQPLRGPDAVAYRLAISACARGGAWQDGLKLLDELRLLDSGSSGSSSSNGADVVAYTAAMNGCEYAGEWQQALILLDKMRKDGVQPNEVTMASVFGACANACAKLVAVSPNHISGNIQQQQILLQPLSSSYREERQVMLPPQQKALKLLQLMKKDETTLVRPNIVVYNAAIRVCAEACDMPRAFALWEDLRREGLDATVVTYGSLMTACERVGNLDGASRVFKSMKEDGLEPNEIIYGAAISCCRKAHEPERAILLLRKMIREGLSPNVATFHTVLVAQTEGSRTKEGHLNFNNNKGDMERAVLVYKLMRSSKYTSSEARPNRQTYHLLIRALAARRYPREAEYLLHKMHQDGMTPDVDLYTATVTAYERSGQPLQALRLMESMREDGYDFYEVKVLNEAFKKAINLVHVVGKGLSSNGENESKANIGSGGSGSYYRFGLDDDNDGVEESFINGR